VFLVGSSPSSIHYVCFDWFMQVVLVSNLRKTDAVNCRTAMVLSRQVTERSSPVSARSTASCATRRTTCISTHLSVNTWYQTPAGQIKWRKVELGVVHFGDRVRARQRSGANGCVKTHSRELSNSRCCGATWVSVKKVRTASVQIFPGKSITAVPVTESIDQGCNVELTQLETNGNAW